MSKRIQIAFDEYGVLYGLSDEGAVFSFNFSEKRWVESVANVPLPESLLKRKKLVESWTAYVGFQHGLPQWGIIGNSSHEVKELILDRFVQRSWTLALSDGWSIEQIEMKKVDDE